MRYILKEQRKSKGLTPKSMAKLLNISTSYYYKIESGTRNPTLDLSQKIREILDVNKDELFANYSWK